MREQVGKLLFLAPLLMATAVSASSPGMVPPVPPAETPEFVLAAKPDTTTYKYKAKGDKVTVKVKSPAAIYYEPQSTARVVERVTLDSAITVLEERGDWILVRTANGEGWIQRPYVDMPDSGLSTVLADATLRGSEGDTVFVKVKSPTKVYFEPLPDARIVEQVTLESPVTVVEDRGDWIRVKTATGEGWVQRTYLDLPGPGGVVTTRTVMAREPATLMYEPITTSRVVTKVTTGVPLSLVEERGDWVRVRTADGEGWVQRTYVDLPGPGGVVTTRTVMVREPTTLMYEPVTTSRIVSNVTAGAPLSLVEERGDWVRVRTADGEGWVQRTYVDVPGAGGVITTRMVTVQAPTSVFFEPAANARVVTSLRTGAPITLVEERGDWIRVRTNTGEGWIRKTTIDSNW